VQKEDKQKVIDDLVARLNASDSLIVADYRGLTMPQVDGLRDELLKHGAQFKVVKNTLTRRAAEQAGADALLVMLEGPTAIAFIEATGDPAAVAKALAQTARATNVLELRGGILEGKPLSGDEVDRLAKLPPLDVLRGQVVGAVVAPLTQLLALVSAPLRELHGLVEARIRQLEDEGEVVAPAAEALVETEDAASEEAADEGLSTAEPAETSPPEDSASAEASVSDESEPTEETDSETEE
jgi:large subunit ribosomal protein L10